MKIIKITLLFLLISGCNQEERFDRINYLTSVKIGQSPNRVVQIMKSEPDIIIFSDSLFLEEVNYTDLVTFIYLTPKRASSNIHLYFKDCELMYTFYDG